MDEVEKSCLNMKKLGAAICQLSSAAFYSKQSIPEFEQAYRQFLDACDRRSSPTIIRHQSSKKQNKKRKEKSIMKVYRYFARTFRPSEIPPFPGIVSVTEYEQPLDSGNGKIMLGYIDVDRELPPQETAAFGLEPAPVNPLNL